MSDPHPPRTDTPPAAGPSPAPLYYPEDHLLGVVDTPAQVDAALEDLTTGGFLDSEVDALCGRAQAERLAASSGRRGLLDRIVRVAEHLGVRDDEMETKARYEQALREGKTVLAVLAPTDERKALAAGILKAHGGHFINFFGRSTIERVAG